MEIEMPERVLATTKTPESEQRCSNSCKQKPSFNSSGSSADRILQLQRTAGNQAVQRLIKSRALQAKLKISQPGDIYEQEADRVAEQVMRMPEPKIQRQPLHVKPLIQRQVLEEKEEISQAKDIAGQSTTITPSIESRISELQSGGQPLDPATRAFFEPRFGQDFSGVRVHTDAKAAEVARAVNARAFTVGRDVVFGIEQYSQRSTEGRRLLGHELTHVVQQGLGLRDNNLTVGGAQVLETEVDKVCTLTSTNQPMNVMPAIMPPIIQRQKNEESFMERQFHKGRDWVMEKGVSYDFSELLNEIMEKGIRQDLSTKGLDGLKVGGLPLSKVFPESSRAFKFVRRLFRFDGQGLLVGLDVQGAIEIYKPRDPHERERIEKAARLMEEWKKLLQPTEERKREEDWVRKEAVRRASKHYLNSGKSECSPTWFGETRPEMDPKGESFTGELIVKYNDAELKDPCVRECVEAHEKVHVEDLKPIIKKIHECDVRAGNDWGKKGKCNKLAQELIEVHEQSECRAYKKSFFCLGLKMRYSKNQCSKSPHREAIQKHMVYELCEMKKHCALAGTPIKDILNI